MGGMRSTWLLYGHFIVVWRNLGRVRGRCSVVITPGSDGQEAPELSASGPFRTRSPQQES